MRRGYTLAFTAKLGHGLFSTTSTLAIVAGMAFYAQPAHAQAAQVAEHLETVVVTAQKRAENLQVVPSSITAISGDVLQSRAITDVRGLVELTPSLKLTTNGTDTEIFIRGVGPGVGGTGNDPAVSMNIDGAYMMRYATSGSFFDLQRVEVLYGPQGTLYGRNSTAGVINVVTKGPGDVYEGTASLGYGNYNSVHGTLGVTIPISDTFSTRIAFNLDKHDGYIHSNQADDTGENDKDDIAGRFSFLWTPTDRFRLRGKLEYWHGGGDGQLSVDFPFINPKDPWYTPFTASEWSSYNNSHYIVANAEADYDFGDGLSLAWIPTYLQNRTNYKTANGGRDALITNVVPTTMTRRFLLPWDSESNELRLSNDSDRFKWVTGLYQYEGDSSRDQGLDYRAFPGLSSSGLGNVPPARIQDSGVNHTMEHAYAIFGQGTYSVEDDLRVTLGLRGSDDNKHEHTYPGTTITYSGFTANHTTQTSVTGTEVIAKTKDQNIDWKIGLEYDLQPAVMAYANIGTGFLDSGTLLQPPPGIPSTFGPEHLTQYAAGLKGDFFDRRLRLNSEFFFYDYKGYQLSTSVISPIGGNIVTTTLNAHRVAIYGADISVNYLIDDDTQFDADLGFLPEAKIISFVSAAGNYSGFRMPQAATMTGTAGINHSWYMSDRSKITAYLDGYYTTGYWASYTHTSGYQAALGKMDARLAYAPADSNWQVELWGRNLTNVAQFSSGSLGFVDLGEPRTFGIRFTTSFGAK